MQYEGYADGYELHDEQQMPCSVVIYPDMAVAEKILSGRGNTRLFHVRTEIAKPFINDPTDPFVDIGKFRPLLPENQYRQLAVDNAERLVETNEWERIQERHPAVPLMAVFDNYPEEFDNLPILAEWAYSSSVVHGVMCNNGYDGAIHAAEGPHGGAGYHTFKPDELTNVRTVSL